MSIGVSAAYSWPIRLCRCNRRQNTRMPVSCLTPAQRENYGRYAAPPTQDELTRYCHLNDDDLTQIMSCRGEHNRLGFALQLTTVRYLGTFLDDPSAVPSSVLETLSRQLGLTTGDGLQTYRSSKQRWEHITTVTAT